MSKLPAGFRSEFVTVNDMRLHVVHNLRPNDNRPAIIFLHGFPEFWIAWREVFVRLADNYAVIAPDQRGFNLSDAPEGKASYTARNMVADLFGIADYLLGDQPFALAGHDWGASVSYAAAITQPKRISHLIIANGVHPVCFQEALIDDPSQRKASQYFHTLTANKAARFMSEDGFRRTLSMFEKFSSTPWLTEKIREEYTTAWARPGRMKAMLNWYRSSPIVVPRPGENAPPPPLYGAPVDKFLVGMPHLLIWGERDQALLPSSKNRLAEFAPNLLEALLPEADHWLLHTHGLRISEEIEQFLH